MPAEPVPAATVILLRDQASGRPVDGEAGPETLLLERHARSEFLPDMYVFPGGRVEAEDAALVDRTTGVSPEAAAEAMGDVDPEHALGFYVAAIRETFEEAGILLARERGSDRLLDPAHAAALSKHRLDVQAGDHSFRDLIVSEGLELAVDLLAVHAHWITPVMVPRRFDTYFFSALAPEGQLAGHDGVEATDHVWIASGEALAQAAAGERQIIFPTACNLQTLVGFASAAEAFEASRGRPVVTVLPQLEESDGKRKLVIPPEAGYSVTEELLER